MNLLGASRSNALRVKDQSAFQSAMDALAVECCWNPDGTVAIAPIDAAIWPSHDDASEQDIDFHAVVASHLADGCVAVLQTAAGAGIYDLAGFALAFTSTGEPVSIDLDDIYARAFDAFGITPVRCDA